MAAAIGFLGAVRAQGKVLRVGATFDASGPERVNGIGMFEGSTAYFNAVNRAGGVNGAKVELVPMDDRFNPDTAKQNALTLHGDSSVVAILHPLGTRQVAAVMDAVPDMPVVGPYTGTVALRKKGAANTFWVRASYEHEIDKLVLTATTLGIGRIGLVHPKDPLGVGLLAAFNAACTKYGIKPAVITTTPSTTSPEVQPAAQEVAKVSPQVLVMGLGAGAAPLFVRALRGAGGTSTVYGLSIAMSTQNIRELGPLARGVGFSIIVPSPFAQRFEIVRRYQTDMVANKTADFSLPSLEGYVDARVLGEGLRRVQGAPTRAGIIAALEQIEALDLGGLRISYGKGRREGSQYVDVAVIGADGRFLS